MCCLCFGLFFVVGLFFGFFVEVEVVVEVGCVFGLVGCFFVLVAYLYYFFGNSNMDNQVIVLDFRLVAG